jgi:hypothetical protein
MDIKTTQIVRNACPSCGTINECASDPTGQATPSAGDLSICLRCGHLTIFNADMSTRELNDEESYRVAGDKRLIGIQKARQRLFQNSKLDD